MIKSLLDKRMVVGAFECVSFPFFDIKDVVAKIDTGADSGAIHCSLIEEVKRANGKRVLRFVPMHNHGTVIETEDYIRAFVRSSTGHRLRRYIVHTEIEIEGKRYSIRIGLSDRSDLQFDVLIGRKFLAEHNMLVDVTQQTELGTLSGE